MTKKYLQEIYGDHEGTGMVVGSPEDLESYRAALDGTIGRERGYYSEAILKQSVFPPISKNTAEQSPTKAMPDDGYVTRGPSAASLELNNK